MLRGPTWLPLPYEKAEEQGFGTWSPVNFQGLLDFGLARSVSWGQQRLLSHTGSGVVVACPWDGRESRCSAPELPGGIWGWVLTVLVLVISCFTRAIIMVGVCHVIHQAFVTSHAK